MSAHPPPPPTTPPPPPPARAPASGPTLSPRVLLGLGVALVVVVVSVVLVGVLTSGGGIRSADGKVVNAEEFLDEVGEQWRDGLPAEGVALHEDAACFFVVGSDDEITGEVACGGVRRYDAAEDAVWDVGTIEVYESGNGVEAYLSYLEETSVDRPRGTLRDGTGDEAPEGIDDVEPPQLPRAEPGVVVTDFDASTTEFTDRVEPGDAGRVRVPGGLVEVTSIATAEAVASLDGYSSYEPDTVPTAPADGERFRVVELALTEADDIGVGDEDVPTSIVLDTGTERVDVLDVDYFYDETATFLVSAAEGASLVLTSDGHEQRIDLATGERAADAVAATYDRAEAGPDSPRDLRWPERRVDLDGEQGEVTLTATVDEARLTPYLAAGLGATQQGWAAEGSAWLVLSVEAEQAEVACCASGSVSATTLTWTATADGTASEPVRVRLEPYAFESSLVVFAVSSTTRRVEVTATARSTVDDYAGGSTTVEHGRRAFAVDLS